MLQVDIKAPGYYENLPYLVEQEEQECNQLNENADVRGLASTICKNMGGWDVAAALVRKYWSYEKYSGASIARNLQQFGLPGYMLTLKIITDQKVFKTAAQPILNTLRDNPLSTNFTTKAYDKKLWEYEDLAEAIPSAAIKCLGGWLGIRNNKVSDINAAWQAAAPADRQVAATNASVIKWTSNEFDSLVPYETPASGNFINIILPAAEPKWLDPAISPEDESSFRLLLSGPSGTSARMMIYFKWFHGLLKDDTAVTAAIKTVLDSVDADSAFFTALSAKRTQFQDNPKAVPFKTLAPWYTAILKGIHMPPFNHHSAYEVETAVTGLLDGNKV